MSDELTTIRVRAAHVTADGTEAADVFRADGAGVRPNGTPGLGIVRSDGKTVVLNARHAAVKQAIADGILVDVVEERKAERRAKADSDKAKAE